MFLADEIVSIILYHLQRDKRGNVTLFGFARERMFRAVCKQFLEIARECTTMEPNQCGIESQWFGSGKRELRFIRESVPNLPHLLFSDTHFISLKNSVDVFSVPSTISFSRKPNSLYRIYSKEDENGNVLYVPCTTSHKAYLYAEPIDTGSNNTEIVVCQFLRSVDKYKRMVYTHDITLSSRNHELLSFINENANGAPCSLVILFGFYEADEERARFKFRGAARSSSNKRQQT